VRLPSVGLIALLAIAPLASAGEATPDDKNGLAPDPRLISSAFAVDLAWDGTGTGNCWAHNVAGTQFPPALPGC